MRFTRSVAAAFVVTSLMTVTAIAWSATPKTPVEEFTRAIRYVGPTLPNISVLPAHLPIPDTSVGIGPGSQILMDRPDGSFLCTANFIWTSGTTKYLGAAGHCFVEGNKDTTHGPDADYDASLTTVYVCVEFCEFGGQVGAIWGEFAKLGKLAYARQNRAGVALGEDFGIVEIPSNLHSQIRSSIPVWGGPSSVGEVSLGEGVCVYGNAAGFGESFPTKARTGIGEGISDNQRYWKAAMPSFQGDSGSSIVTCGQDEGGLHGQAAAGILTHIGLGNHTGRIIGTTMGQAADMTLRDAGISIQAMLEDGTLVSPTPPPPPPPPPPAPPTPSPDGTVDVGQSYSWSAGPFERIAPVTTVIDGEACDNVRSDDDHCDYEWVQVNVPAGGATLKVTVSSEDDTADFDLYVFGPNGQEVNHSANPVTPPEVVEEVVKTPGVYTIAVNPYIANNASYNGLLEVSAPPAPPPAPSPVQGNPYIYQGGLINPFVLTGGDSVVRGTPVKLSVRGLKSTSSDITLTLDPKNFEGSHRIVDQDGQVVYGPFDTVEGTDGANFRTESNWTVPSDAASGTYFFEAFVTIGTQTYKTGTLEFMIL